MHRPLIAAALLLALAACDRGEKQSSLVINTGDGDAAVATTSGSGEMKIDVPGFKGDLKLPRITMKPDQFSLNGVHLYPGSTIEGMNVSGDSGGGDVRIRFASPADPATVRQWFADRLGKAGYTIAAEGPNLVGKTDDDKPFRLDLAADGTDASKGEIVLGQ